jgi:hypothetical protein
MRGMVEDVHDLYSWRIEAHLVAFRCTMLSDLFLSFVNSFDHLIGASQERLRDRLIPTPAQN